MTTLWWSCLIYADGQGANWLEGWFSSVRIRVAVTDSPPPLIPPVDYISIPQGLLFWSNWKLKVIRKWYCILWVALHFTSDNACYRGQCTLQVALNDISIACYKWHCMIQMHCTLQVALHATGDIVCYRYHWMLWVALHVIDGIMCYRWHCTLEISLHVTGDIACCRWYCML